MEEEKGEQSRRQGLLVAKILLFAKDFRQERCFAESIIFSPKGHHVNVAMQFGLLTFYFPIIWVLLHALRRTPNKGIKQKELGKKLNASVKFMRGKRRSVRQRNRAGAALTWPLVFASLVSGGSDSDSCPTGLSWRHSLQGKADSWPYTGRLSFCVSNISLGFEDALCPFRCYFQSGRAIPQPPPPPVSSPLPLS